jgi:hypothetical protein
MYGCDGNGGSGMHDCTNCSGSGMVIGVINTPFGAFQQGVECHVCEGIGQTIHHNVRVVMVMVYHLSRKLLMLLFLLVFLII